MTAPARSSVAAPVAAKIGRLRGDFALWAGICYHIRDKRDRLVTLRLNGVQRAIEAAEAQMMAALGRVRLYILKGRQAGITTLEQAKNLHTIWSRRGAAVMTLGAAAGNDGDVERAFVITQRAVQHFPPKLLPQMGRKEAREFSFTARDSRFWTGTAGAKRQGQGTTLRRLHGSEFASWKDPVDTLATVAPALERPGTAIVLETTASGHGAPAHAFWLEAQRGANGYRALFFPWWECDPVTYRLPLLAPDELGPLDQEEAALIHRGLDFEQIKWRRAMIATMGLSRFLQEYAEDADSCWLMAGGAFFDGVALRALAGRKPEPVETLMAGALRLFYDRHATDDLSGRPLPHLKPGERVIIGADVAAGVGGDASTFSARTFPTWRLLAEFGSDRIEPAAFGDLLDVWGRKLGGEKPAFLVIERNSHGITVLRQVRDKRKYPSSAIYHRVALDEESPEAQDRIGWVTSEATVPLMLDAIRALLAAAQEGDVGAPSALTLADAAAVRYDVNGKISLNGRDYLVAEALAWLGREQLVRHSVPKARPTHWH